MVIKSSVYSRLPTPIQSIVKQWYEQATYGTTTEKLDEAFVDRYFPSRKVCECYVKEFETGPAKEYQYPTKLVFYKNHNDLAITKIVGISGYS